MAVIHQVILRPSKSELLAEWLPGQTWWPNGIAEFSIEDSFRLDDPAGEVGVEALLLRSAAGESFHVPLTYRGAPCDGAGLVGTLEHPVLGHRWVYDAPTDPVYRAVVADTIRLAGHQANEELHQADGSVTEAELTAHAWGTGGADGLDEVCVIHRPAKPVREDDGAPALLATWANHPEPAVLVTLS